MGNDLKHGAPAASRGSRKHRSQGGANAPVPWLDRRTARAVRAVTLALAREQPEVRAVILFGSVARHDERPLDDSEPSDVDLLVLVDPGPGLTRLPLERALAIHGAAGEAAYRLPEAPRELQITLAKSALDDWDPTFVENVAADGILLWARGPLPAVLGAVERRASLTPGAADRPQGNPVP